MAKALRIEIALFSTEQILLLKLSYKKFLSVSKKSIIESSHTLWPFPKWKVGEIYP